MVFRVLGLLTFWMVKTVTREGGPKKAKIQDGVKPDIFKLPQGAARCFTAGSRVCAVFGRHGFRATGVGVPVRRVVADFGQSNFGQPNLANPFLVIVSGLWLVVCPILANPLLCCCAVVLLCCCAVVVWCCGGVVLWCVLCVCVCWCVLVCVCVLLCVVCCCVVCCVLCGPVPGHPFFDLPNCHQP